MNSEKCKCGYVLKLIIQMIVITRNIFKFLSFHFILCSSIVHFDTKINKFVVYLQFKMYCCNCAFSNLNVYKGDFHKYSFCKLYRYLRVFYVFRTYEYLTSVLFDMQPADFNINDNLECCMEPIHMCT